MLNFSWHVEELTDHFYVVLSALMTGDKLMDAIR